MKSIIISVRPEWAQKILSGEKTLELRKSVPKDFVGWVYMYVTKAKPTLHRLMVENGKEWYLGSCLPFGWVVNRDSNFNGKVVARWWFDEYTKLRPDWFIGLDDGYIWDGKGKENNLCLSFLEISDYLKPKHIGYAWHIKRLEIIDKPMELGEFYKGDMKKYIDVNGVNQFNYYFKVTRAPQSWRYVWVKE